MISTFPASDRTFLDNTAILAIFLSASIFATTIHAQDFEDVPGDKVIGRRTLPIVHPSWARFTVIATLSAWSFGLWYIWDLDATVASTFCALAFFVGYRYIALTSIAQDQTSFKWYNVSVHLVRVLFGDRCADHHVTWIGLAIRCTRPARVLPLHSCRVTEVVHHTPAK